MQEIHLLPGLPRRYLAISNPARALFWTRRPEFYLPPYKGRGSHPKKKKPSIDPQSVAEIARDPALHWEPVKLGEGAKGPTICYFTCLRVIEHRDGQALDELWLILQKNTDGEIRAMLSNAQVEITFEELLRVSQMRWTIEQLFQEDKDFLQGGQTPEGSFWKDKVLDESPVIRFSSFSMSTISLFAPWVAQ